MLRIVVLALAALGSILSSNDAASQTPARHDPYASLPAVGDPVPPFSLPTLSGGQISSADMQQTPTLLAFWSANCFASRLALQEIQRLFTEGKTRGYDVVVLANDTDTARLRTVLDSAGVSVPVAYASGRLGDLFGQLATNPDAGPSRTGLPLPSFLLLNSRGAVVLRYVGVHPQTGLAGLQAQIDSTLEPTH